MIVGMTGFRRCGKDTAASFLIKRGFVRYAFADALREMARAIDPVISLHDAPENVWEKLPHLPRQNDQYRYSELIDLLGYDLAKGVPDFRRYLQRLGTEGVRTTFGPNAWVDALERRYNAEQPALLVITDVRFHSESDWISSRGGVLWRINRPGFGGDDPHPSEREVPNLPAVLDITATSLVELEAAVLAAVRDIETA